MTSLLRFETPAGSNALNKTGQVSAGKSESKYGRSGALILPLALLVGLTSAPRQGSGLERSIPWRQQPGAEESRGIPKTPLEFSQRVNEIREYVQGFLKESVVPGISIGLAVGDEFTHLEGFGFADLDSRRPVTPQTRFRIGSVSKTLTAAALGLLLEDGELDLEADVRRYVPEFPDKGSPITLRHLACHQSGIRHYRGDESLSDSPYKSVLEALKVFAGDPLIGKPGTAHSYSTYGYTLLSAAMERGAGQAFLALMTEKVLRPLQMTQTGPEVGGRPLPDQATGYVSGADGKAQVAPKTDLSNIWAGGGFVSTAGDLLKFAQAHFHGRFLQPKTLDLLWTHQTTDDGTETRTGIGWQVAQTPKGRRLLVSGGNSIGGTVVMFVLPEERIVLAFLTNMTSAPIRGVPKKALEILLGEGDA
jgi:serine beta-lactamase-like protein LACTB